MTLLQVGCVDTQGKEVTVDIKRWKVGLLQLNDFLRVMPQVRDLEAEMQAQAAAVPEEAVLKETAGAPKVRDIASEKPLKDEIASEPIKATRKKSTAKKAAKKKVKKKAAKKKSTKKKAKKKRKR